MSQATLTNTKYFWVSFRKSWLCKASSILVLIVLPLTLACFCLWLAFWLAFGLPFGLPWLAFGLPLACPLVWLWLAFGSSRVAEKKIWAKRPDSVAVFDE
jgi:hypothetical protein